MPPGEPFDWDAEASRQRRPAESTGRTVYRGRTTHFVIRRRPMISTEILRIIGLSIGAALVMVCWWFRG